MCAIHKTRPIPSLPQLRVNSTHPHHVIQCYRPSSNFSSSWRESAERRGCSNAAYSKSISCNRIRRCVIRSPRPASCQLGERQHSSHPRWSFDHRWPLNSSPIVICRSSQSGGVHLCWGGRRCVGPFLK